MPGPFGRRKSLKEKYKDTAYKPLRAKTAPHGDLTGTCDMKRWTATLASIVALTVIVCTAFFLTQGAPLDFQQIVVVVAISAVLVVAAKKAWGAFR